MDTSGARFVPIVDLTDDDGDTISHMSEIPLQLPTSANASSNNSALVTFAQAGERSRATRSLSPTDTKSDQCESFALMYPATYPQCVPAVLGPQEVVQLVTQRAREALHDQRETARRALLRQQGRLLAATHQHAAAAGQNPVKILARNSEAQHYNVQMHVRQLERTVIAIFSGRKSNS